MSKSVDLEPMVCPYFLSWTFVTIHHFVIVQTWTLSLNRFEITTGVSSRKHLLGKPLLRAAVWGISCVTCLGNALVLWGRLTARDENRVLSIMIRNLAGNISFFLPFYDWTINLLLVSDMLMGVYLFIIAIKDVEFRDSYISMVNDWTSSWTCTFAGALAMTSSEVNII